MNREKLSSWILVSAALAFVLLLFDASLLTCPFTKHEESFEDSLLFPIRVLALIANWIGLGHVLDGCRGFVWAGWLIWPVPWGVFVVNLTILSLAQERQWRPKWLAWFAFFVPMAISGSVLVAFTVSLTTLTSILPWPCAGAVFSLLMLAVAKLKGWRPLWPWWMILLFSGSYVFLVLLTLILARVGVVHHLL